MELETVKLDGATRPTASPKSQSFPILPAGNHIHASSDALVDPKEKFHAADVKKVKSKQATSGNKPPPLMIPNLKQKKMNKNWYQLSWRRQIQYHFSQASLLQKLLYVVGGTVLLIGGFLAILFSSEVLSSKQISKQSPPASSSLRFGGINGQAGFQDGDSSAALFKAPFGVAADDEGNIYVADSGNQAIRKISQSGIVSTLISSNSSSLSKRGSAVTLVSPRGLAIDSHGLLYITDVGDNTIKVLNTSSRSLLVLAGQPSFGDYRDSTFLKSLFYEPSALVLSKTGIFVGDSGNCLVRVLLPDSTVDTYAGSGNGSVKPVSMSEVSRLEDSFNHPYGVAIDSKGFLYVADSKNGRIQRIDPKTGISTTLRVSEKLQKPTSIVIDALDNLYVSDEVTGNIMKINNSSSEATFLNLTASSETANKPTALAISSSGVLYYTSCSSNSIVSYNSSGSAKICAPASLPDVPDNVVTAIESAFQSTSRTSSTSATTITTTNAGLSATGKISTVSSTSGNILVRSSTVSSPSTRTIACEKVVTSFRETNGTKLSGIVVEPNSGNVFVGDADMAGNTTIRILSSQNDTITPFPLPSYFNADFRIYSFIVMVGGISSVNPSLLDINKTEILHFLNNVKQNIKNFTFLNSAKTTSRGVAAYSLNEAYFTDGSLVRKLVIDPVNFTITSNLIISANFTSAYGIAIDSRGHIIVSENITGSFIKILLQDGGYINIPGTNISGKTPTHIAVYRNFLYVIDRESTAIRNISISEALNDTSCEFPVDPNIVFYKALSTTLAISSAPFSYPVSITSTLSTTGNAFSSTAGSSAYPSCSSTPCH